MKKAAILIFPLLLSLNIFAQMTLVFNTNLGVGTEITLPLHGTVDVTIDWGDGTNDVYIEAANVEHSYASEGIYTVAISGELTHFGDDTYNYQPYKLTKVTDFGDIGLTDLSNAFKSAYNLTEVPVDIPSSVVNTSFMFRNANTFNQDIGSWDVSNVTNMSSMFRNTSSFNQSIGSWDVSQVCNMNWMFHEASSFNQDIGSWEVINVTDMSYMFCSASDFNQYIGSWDVSQVTDMQSMFAVAESFNQEIRLWNVSQVITMEGMFVGALSFNQDIGDWDVSQVTNMEDMFNGASSFNQDIKTWDVGQVTDMEAMFGCTIVPHPVGFTIFNQDIGAWDVSNVFDMRSMFSHNIAFNQDIGSWDVSNVTLMYGMFAWASAFDQDLGTWDVSQVNNLCFMFDEVTLSTSNYDALLNGWSIQSLHSGVFFDGGNSQYSCAAEVARASMINNNAWEINDGGFVGDTVNTNVIVGGENIIAEASGSTFQWLDCSDNYSIIQGEDQSVYTATYNGDFAVEVTEYGCVDTSNCVNISSVDIEYNKILEGVKIFPNPTTGQFQIDAKDITKIEILSSTGQLLRTIKPDNKNTSVDLSQEAKGIYFVKLISSKGIETAKLVLE